MIPRRGSGLTNNFFLSSVLLLKPGVGGSHNGRYQKDMKAIQSEKKKATFDLIFLLSNPMRILYSTIV